MSRRCQRPVCPETFDPALIINELNWCLKCWDEYCAVMARYRTRHANADGRQLDLIPAAPATPLI